MIYNIQRIRLDGFLFTFEENAIRTMKIHVLNLKQIVWIGSLILICRSGFSQSVSIGDTSLGMVPTASLHLLDTNLGFMINRLTTAQRNAISNPATGLQVFNVSNRCLEIYFPGTGWKSIACECTVAPAAPTSIQGPGQICPGDTVSFSSTSVLGATQYQWTFPSGSTIISGIGSDSIQVALGQASGTVSVVAQNGCGNSPSTTLPVLVAFPDSTFTVNPQSPSINSQAQFTALQLGASYSWTFSSGTPANSTQATQGVTWTQAGNYNVGLTATLYPGCFSSSIQNITVNACPPPLQSSVSFSYTGSVQNWTVPACATTIRIQASGGKGGNSQGGSQGGLGARMQGDFQVNPGSVLTIVVGKQGNTNGDSGGGGGGSGVLFQGSPWIIAGGGGGINNAQNFGGLAGTTSTAGSTGEYGGGSGGSNGGDGGGTVYSGSNFAYGGKGLNSGLSGSTGTNGVSNLTTTTQGVYGLGGGGGSVGGGYCNCGGGGGGYSGGGAGGVNGSGGGGGSFNLGGNQINQGGIQSGDGQVVIWY